MKSKRYSHLLRNVAIGAAGAGTLALGGAAAWLAYSSLVADRRRPLRPAIDAERRTMKTSLGQAMSYYVDYRSGGRPLVLLHSINAAASAYEMKPLFDAYAGRRPVYAPDLPGFGFSDRVGAPFTRELYLSAVIDMLTRVREQWGPADVVALSLTSEIAAIAALLRRDLVHSLTLISPTGLSSVLDDGHPPDRLARAGKSNRIERVLGDPRFAPAAQALFTALVSRPSISYFLRKSFVGPADPGLVAYAYDTAHQPHARFAPLAFLSGKLFTPDVRESVYLGLRVPVLVLYDEDPYVGFETLPALVERNPRWSAIRIGPSRGMPHFEKPDETTAALDVFFHQPHAASSVAPDAPLAPESSDSN